MADWQRLRFMTEGDAAIAAGKLLTELPGERVDIQGNLAELGIVIYEFDDGFGFGDVTKGLGGSVGFRPGQLDEFPGTGRPVAVVHLHPNPGQALGLSADDLRFFGPGLRARFGGRASVYVVDRDGEIHVQTFDGRDIDPTSGGTSWGPLAPLVPQGAPGPRKPFSSFGVPIRGTAERNPGRQGRGRQGPAAGKPGAGGSNSGGDERRPPERADRGPDRGEGDRRQEKTRQQDRQRADAKKREAEQKKKEDEAKKKEEEDKKKDKDGTPSVINMAGGPPVIVQPPKNPPPKSPKNDGGDFVNPDADPNAAERPPEHLAYVPTVSDRAASALAALSRDDRGPVGPATDGPGQAPELWTPFSSRGRGESASMNRMSAPPEGRDERAYTPEDLAIRAGAGKVVSGGPTDVGWVPRGYVGDDAINSAGVAVDADTLRKLLWKLHVEPIIRVEERAQRVGRAARSAMSSRRRVY